MRFVCFLFSEAKDLYLSLSFYASSAPMESCRQFSHELGLYFCSILTSGTFFPPINPQPPCVFKEPCKTSSPALSLLWWGASQSSAFPLLGLAHGVPNRRTQTENQFIWDLPGCARERSSCSTSVCRCHILHTSSVSLPPSLGLLWTSL